MLLNVRGAKSSQYLYVLLFLCATKTKNPKTQIQKNWLLQVLQEVTATGRMRNSFSTAINVSPCEWPVMTWSAKIAREVSALVGQSAMKGVLRFFSLSFYLPVSVILNRALSRGYQWEIWKLFKGSRVITCTCNKFSIAHHWGFKFMLFNLA